MANIPTTEDLEKMILDLKLYINEKLKPDQAEVNQPNQISWKTAKVIEQETGLKAKTLFDWKSKGGLLKEGEDFSRFGRLYFWNIKSIEAILSGKRKYPEKWKDSQLSSQ